MSYDINIVKNIGDENAATCKFKHNIGGGTQCLGGTNELWLNITYNYCEHFQVVLGEEGIRSIYNKKVIDTLSVLMEAAFSLKEDYDDDYWKPTEGNARLALLDLVRLGLYYPEGYWVGD